MLPTFLVARKPRFTGSTRNASNAGNPDKGGNPGAGTVFSGDVVASSVAATIARRVGSDTIAPRGGGGGDDGGSHSAICSLLRDQ